MQASSTFMLQRRLSNERAARMSHDMIRGRGTRRRIGQWFGAGEPFSSMSCFSSSRVLSSSSSCATTAAAAGATFGSSSSSSSSSWSSWAGGGVAFVGACSAAGVYSMTEKDWKRLVLTKQDASLSRRSQILSTSPAKKDDFSHLHADWDQFHLESLQYNEDDEEDEEDDEDDEDEEDREDDTEAQTEEPPVSETPIPNNNDKDEEGDEEEEEETTCSICLINRQGPCRKVWRHFERCIKENSPPPPSSSQGDTSASTTTTVDPSPAAAGGQCDKYFQPWFECFAEHRDVYALITNRQIQPEMDLLEEMHDTDDFPDALVPLLEVLTEDNKEEEEVQSDDDKDPEEQANLVNADTQENIKETLAAKDTPTTTGPEKTTSSHQDEAATPTTLEPETTTSSNQEEEEVTPSVSPSPSSSTSTTTPTLTSGLLQRYAKLKLKNSTTGNTIRVAYARDEEGNLIGFDYFGRELREGMDVGEMMFLIPPNAEKVTLFAFYERKEEQEEEEKKEEKQVKEGDGQGMQEEEKKEDYVKEQQEEVKEKVYKMDIELRNYG